MSQEASVDPCKRMLCTHPPTSSVIRAHCQPWRRQQDRIQTQEQHRRLHCRLLRHVSLDICLLALRAEQGYTQTLRPPPSTRTGHLSIEMPCAHSLGFFLYSIRQHISVCCIAIRLRQKPPLRGVWGWNPKP